MPLPSHITAVPNTAPAHPYNCPCPPVSDYLMVVYLTLLKGEEGEVDLLIRVILNYPSLAEC